MTAKQAPRYEVWQTVENVWRARFKDDRSGPFDEQRDALAWLVDRMNQELVGFVLDTPSVIFGEPDKSHAATVYFDDASFDPIPISLSDSDEPIMVGEKLTQYGELRKTQHALELAEQRAERAEAVVAAAREVADEMDRWAGAHDLHVWQGALEPVGQRLDALRAALDALEEA